MITFCDYMDQMLYGPAGYYTSGTAQSGKAGDYFTAPDVGSAMGQLLAEIFLGWKEKLQAETFSLIEAGAGEGRLEEATLSIMILPIGRQQKISHQFAQAFSHFVRERARQQRKEKQFAEDESTCNLPIREIARIFRQNIADMLRSEQEDAQVGTRG